MLVHDMKDMSTEVSQAGEIIWCGKDLPPHAVCAILLALHHDEFSDGEKYRQAPAASSFGPHSIHHASQSLLKYPGSIPY